MKTAMPRCRPFKLMDIMILVATAAIGMAEMRHGWVQFRTVWAGMKMDPNRQAYAGLAQAGSVIALLNLAVAYTLIRLIPPRLPTSDLIRQPGMLVSGLLLGLALILLPLSAFVPLDSPTQRIFAVTLGVCWCVACLRYRSRAEPGWIEGLGRFFGVGLILAIAAT